jgi:hypothetical protein
MVKESKGYTKTQKPKDCGCLTWPKYNVGLSRLGGNGSRPTSLTPVILQHKIDTIMVQMEQGLSTKVLLKEDVDQC